MTDGELEALVTGPESERLERKEAIVADKLREAICAFANDLPGSGQPGLTDYRNPSLAGTLGQLGFVQRFGAGIAIARAALASNGNPPLELHPTPTHVLVTARFE